MLAKYVAQQSLNVAITERMQAIPHTLATIPGIGPVLSGGITSDLSLRRIARPGLAHLP